MRNFLQGLFLLFIISGLGFISFNAFSQTAGTMTFHLTPASTGGYTPKHCMAIWIENAAGTFIKTKLKQSSNSNLDHLATWTGKSAQNVVDATSGATATSNSTLTVTWNGTNVSGAVVPDGIYKIWVEFAWASSMTTGKVTQSFSFTKGVAEDHQLPTATANLTAMTLDWVPTASLVETVSSNQEINIYPNPSNGILNVDIDPTNSSSIVKIGNTIGLTLFEEKIEPSFSGTKKIDLSKFPNGIYFINIVRKDKNYIRKIVLNK